MTFNPGTSDAVMLLESQSKSQFCLTPHTEDAESCRCGGVIHLPIGSTLQVNLLSCTHNARNRLTKASTMPNAIKYIKKVDTTSFDYIFEKNVDIPLKTGGLIRANVYRPKGDGKYPAIVTYGPYGKDVYYGE